MVSTVPQSYRVVRLIVLILWLVGGPLLLFRPSLELVGRLAPFAAAFLAGLAIFLFRLPFWARAAAYIFYGLAFGMGTPIFVLAIWCGLFHDCP